MAESTKLNLGCGPEVVSGWDNLDKSPGVLLARLPRLRKLLGRLKLISSQQVEGFPPGVIFADLTKRIPFPDQSVDYIYCGHMIEHLSPSASSAMLDECRRIIKPGGLVRFSTPDLREFVDEYLGAPDDAGNQPADALMVRLGTYVDSDGPLLKRFLVRHSSAFHHQWLYDAASLKAKFVEAGFENVEQASFHDGTFPDLDRLEFREEGLFLNAVG